MLFILRGCLVGGFLHLPILAVWQLDCKVHFAIMHSPNHTMEPQSYNNPFRSFWILILHSHFQSILVTATYTAIPIVSLISGHPCSSQPFFKILLLTLWMKAGSNQFYTDICGVYILTLLILALTFCCKV